MALSHRIFRSIQAADPDSWNLVRSGSEAELCTDIRFLRAVEESMSDVSSFWHVLFFDGADRPVGSASLSTFRLDLGVLAAPAVRGPSRLIRKVLPSFLRPKIVFCGLPVSVGQKNLLVVPTADGAEVLAELDRLVFDIAETEKAAIVVYKEFGERDLGDMDALLERGYSRADSLGMHHFQPRFSDFAEYLGELTSHYRYDIKRSARKLEDAGIRTARWRDPADIARLYTDQVHQLYEAVVDNAENQLERLPAEFFRNLASRFPGQVSLTTLSADEEILAFNWALRSERTYDFLFCGLDYERNREADLYFNLMYTDLDNALRENVQDIRLGQTSDRFKARLGCESWPLYAYVKGVKPLTDRLLRAGFDQLFPPRTPVPECSIYKKTTYSSATQRTLRK